MRQFVAGLTLFGMLVAAASAQAGITVLDYEFIGDGGFYDPIPDHKGFVHDDEFDLIHVDFGPTFGLPSLEPAYCGKFVAINGSGGAGSIYRQGDGLFDFLDLHIRGVYGDVAGSLRGYKSGNPVADAVTFVASNSQWLFVEGNFASIDELRITVNIGSLYLIDNVRLARIIHGGYGVGL